MQQAFTWAQGQASSDDDTLTLTFEQRQRSRYQATSQRGASVGWFIERGHVLQAGDVLICETGERFAIRAAAETLSEVTSSDPLLLTRVAYHLGNRHVPVAIAAGVLRYQHDHVLDAMVQGLGLAVTVVEQPFTPEAGAYASSQAAGHSHSHSHSHGHSDSHAHHHQHDH